MLVALALLTAVGAGGCTTVVDSLASVLGPSQVGGDVDAHVVYRIRPDCSAMLARTIGNGYTVLTPAATGVPLTAPFVVEETGVFDGPVRTGEVIFRYVPPAESQTWAGEPIDVTAEVDAVRLDLEGGHERLVEMCGPMPEVLSPDPTIPRIPGQ